MRRNIPRIQQVRSLFRDVNISVKMDRWYVTSAWSRPCFAGWDLYIPALKHRCSGCDLYGTAFERHFKHKERYHNLIVLIVIRSMLTIFDYVMQQCRHAHFSVPRREILLVCMSNDTPGSCQLSRLLSWSYHRCHTTPCWRTYPMSVQKST